MKQNEPDTLEKIQKVWKRWAGSTHRWRSSHAMVEINAILIEAKVREKRLRAISDAAKKEREAKNGKDSL